MKRTEGMPLWVFLALANINTRKGAAILYWSSLAFSFACIPLSWYLGDWSWAGFMFAFTAWYWLAARWVDRHAQWEQS